jgi:hypothetical protein
MQGVEDDEKIGNLEKQMAEAQVIAAEADKRYDEVLKYSELFRKSELILIKNYRIVFTSLCYYGS